MSEQEQIIINPATTPDAELEKQIECYSWMWAKNEQQCIDCLVRDRCIMRIVKARMPKLAKDKGADLEPADLEASEHQSDYETAVTLIQISKGKKISELLPPQATQAPATPSPPEDDVEDEPGEEAEDGDDGDDAAPTNGVSEEPVFQKATPVAAAPTPPKKAPKKAPPKAPKKEATPKPKKEPVKKAPAADVVPAPIPEAAPAAPEEAPMKTTEPKKKAPPKAAKPTKKEPEKKAPPAKKDATTHALAPTKEVAARAAKAKPPKFDEQAFTSAWERERTRSPAVAALSPGDKLEKEYRGVNVTVTYRKGYVEWDGAKWPTLSAVKTAVVGKKDYPLQHGKEGSRAMTDWSVPRFFQLGSKPKAASPKKAAPAPKKAAPKVIKKAATKKAAPKKAAKKVKK